MSRRRGGEDDRESTAAAVAALNVEFAELKRKKEAAVGAAPYDLAHNLSMQIKSLEWRLSLQRERTTI